MPAMKMRGLAVKRAAPGDASVPLAAGDVLGLRVNVVAGMLHVKVEDKGGVLITAILSPREAKDLAAVVLVHAEAAEAVSDLHAEWIAAMCAKLDSAAPASTFLLLRRCEGCGMDYEARDSISVPDANRPHRLLLCEPKCARKNAETIFLADYSLGRPGALYDAKTLERCREVMMICDSLESAT